GWDPRFSERLVLVFSTPELVGPEQGFPPHYAFVGPAFGARPPAPGFPWQRLDPARRRVLVSLGTLNQAAGARFYGAVLGAAERLAGEVQFVLAAPAALIGHAPDHLLLQESVPQPALLPHLDAVVCHAGHNTVCEALAHGLPLVVAPIRDDQPIVARQVALAGAGVRVRFGRTRAEELRDALTAVLDDPGPRRAARRIQASFAAAGGAAAAADRLEKLL
ncbi:glycosyltransferase, partial [Streptomyces nojiriensis]